MILCERQHDRQCLIRARELHPGPLIPEHGGFDSLLLIIQMHFESFEFLKTMQRLLC